MALWAKLSNFELTKKTHLWVVIRLLLQWLTIWILNGKTLLLNPRLDLGAALSHDVTSIFIYRTLDIYIVHYNNVPYRVTGVITETLKSHNLNIDMCFEGQYLIQYWHIMRSLFYLTMFYWINRRLLRSQITLRNTVYLQSWTEFSQHANPESYIMAQYNVWAEECLCVFCSVLGS